MVAHSVWVDVGFHWEVGPPKKGGEHRESGAQWILGFALNPKREPSLQKADPHLPSTVKGMTCVVNNNTVETLERGVFTIYPLLNNGSGQRKSSFQSNRSMVVDTAMSTPRAT